jgi:3-phenylpropionate/trans-cinnamate dioxygenase ferredoxin component
MAEYITICPISDIPNGKREVFDINGRWVAIFNVDNRYYAIEDVCTHDGNTLTEDARGNPVPLDGYEIECPRHGARFDIRNGKVLSVPAVKDVRWYPVRVQDEQIQLLI